MASEAGMDDDTNGTLKACRAPAVSLRKLDDPSDTRPEEVEVRKGKTFLQSEVTRVMQKDRQSA